jgi:pyruvate-formate lyase
MIGVDKLPTRKVNPLEISEDEQAKLQSYIPFWMDKNMVYLAFDGQEEQMRFGKEQIEALQYQLYEAGGIAHLAPGYEKVIKLGAEGIIAEVEAFEAQTNDPSKLDFYQSVKISMNALAEFGDRYATEARRLAEAEADPQRKLDLERIAEVCAGGVLCQVVRNHPYAFRRRYQHARWADQLGGSYHRWPGLRGQRCDQ